MSFFQIIAASSVKRKVGATPIDPTEPPTTEMELVIDTTNYVFPKEDYEALVGTPANPLWSQNVFYHNGACYFVFQQWNNPRVGILRLDENGLRPLHFIQGNKTIYETHDRPVIWFQGNRMLIVQEDGHDTYPTTIHRAYEDGESLIFSSNAATIPTYPPTYPNLYENNGDIVFISQAGTSPMYVINRAGDLMVNDWSNGAGEYNTLLEKSGDEGARYQPSVSNKQLANDIYFTSCGRALGPSEPHWFRYNVFRARINPNGYLNFYTVDGKLIYEGSAGSTSMNTTMVEMGKFYELPTAKTGRVPQNTIDHEGNFYSLHEDGDNGLMLSYWLVASTTPVNRSVNLPDSPNIIGGETPQVGAGAMILTIGESLHIFVKVDNGSRIIVHQYKSTDLGINWGFVQAIDFGFSVVNIKVPDNYGSIPEGENFLLIAGESGVLEPDEFGTIGSEKVDVAARKIAFNSIGQESNVYDTVPSITELDFKSSSILNYSIEAGKITNTGNILNTLIDQSPNGNDLTSFGNPVIDNETTPSYLTLDGVDDYFSINPNLLLPDNHFLILSVMESLSGNDAPITISDNSISNGYITPVLRTSDIAVRTAYNGLAGTVTGGDIALDGFNVCAWLFRGKAHDIPMWLNGKMQDRHILAPTDFNFEGSYILPNGNTNVEIGRLVRTSTAYYNFRMKHLSVHSITNEKQILERIKFLSNKYGIALQNPYR